LEGGAIACVCHNNGGKMFHAFEINLPNDRQPPTGATGNNKKKTDTVMWGKCDF